MPETREYAVAQPARRGGRLSPGTKHFIRHYVEMVVAMFAGMGVLWIPAGWALGALGTSWHELAENAPAAMFLGMATTMTLPMVGWMLYRGHRARASLEMAASMFLPTFAVITIMWAGALTDHGALMTIEHVAMLLAMLGVMRARPAEYSGHHGRGGRA